MDTELLKTLVKWVGIGMAFWFIGGMITAKAGLSEPIGFIVMVIAWIGFCYFYEQKQAKKQEETIEDFITKEVERRSKERV